MKILNINRALLLLFIITGLLVSCGKNYMYVRGNGQIGAETRNVQPFEGVVLEGSFEVIIKHDTITEVIVEAETNLIPFIETYVTGTALVVREKPHTNLKANDPIRVFVKTPKLRYAELEGSGMLSTEQFVSDNLNLNISGSGRLESGGVLKRVYGFISGSGEIYLSGLADIAEFSISGSGNIDAYALQADTCYANISGSGNMYVYVIDLLDAGISGSGNIYYKGNPTVYNNITGSGAVIHVP